VGAGQPPVAPARVRLFVAGARTWAPAVFLSGIMMLNPKTSDLDRPNFTKRNVQPPAAQYVSADDLLLVQSMNSHATTLVEVRGRLLLPDNSVQRILYTHTPNRDRSSKAEPIAFGPGYLLSLMAVPTATDVRRGDTFITLGLTSGAAAANPATHVLAQDYLSSSEAMGWPGSPVHSSIAGVGTLRTFLGTAPAIGVNVSETVPTNARWRILGFNFALTTSAVVGNRSVHFALSNGVFDAFRTPALTPQTASTTVSYYCSAIQSRQTSVANLATIEIAENLWAPQGWTLRTIVTGMDAGDLFGAPTLYVEEWLEE
jgi:hypothetical protein